MLAALSKWSEQGELPEWVEKLAGQIKKRLEVLKLVPPTPEEEADD